MKTCLRPYEGTQPYIFVSYAHKNDAAVLEIIGTLQSRGFRVWYDEGIEAGSEWPESIASHLERAQLVLAFLSPAYLQSDNCRKEMHYALTKKKPVINVYLEQTELSPGMEMQIGNLFALMKYAYPSEEYFYDKLFSAELLDADKFAGEAPELPPEAHAEPQRAKKKKEKKPRAEKQRRERPAKAPKPERAKKKRGIAAAIIAVVLAGCLIAAGIVGHFTGLLYRFTAKTVAVQTLPDDTVAAFQNPLLEQAAREYAGKPEGELTVADLKGLTALYVCGDRYWFAAPQQGVDTAAAGVEAAEVIDPSGRSVTVQRGAIRDLSDLAYFSSLRELALEFQSLTTLESLPACGVEVFDISANRLTSLAGIEQLPKLTALLADGNAVTELTGLGRCLNVRTLHLNGANVSDLSELRALTKLQDITLSHCTRRELLIPLHKSSLTRVTLVDCDLRGDFFHSFDRERAITSLTLIRCELDSTSGLDGFTGLTELTLHDVSGALDWSALGSLPLQTVTTDAMQADAIRASGTTAAVTVTD